MVQQIINGVTPSTYVASASTVFLGLNVEAWGIAGVVVGITVTILTYLTNLYFRSKGK